MNTRMMAFMGCRILAMYWLYYSSGEVSAALLNIKVNKGHLPVTFGLGVYLALYPIFLAIAAVLWFGAGWLSKLIAQGTRTALLSCNSEAIATGAAVATGLLLASFSLQLLFFYLIQPNGLPIPWIDTIAPAIALGSSIWLLVNARLAFLLQGQTHVS